MLHIVYGVKKTKLQQKLIFTFFDYPNSAVFSAPNGDLLEVEVNNSDQNVSEGFPIKISTLNNTALPKVSPLCKPFGIFGINTYIRQNNLDL
ncbi:unnamed protein product [Schistosoma mattheei]|uniref:Uncharacterized protein n=1 Tax=Schistosoma mattheei TaxID=31246 RepID=A0A183P311_9TREM|nr:unnamed protein product [Schistosoma mattheei]